VITSYHKLEFNTKLWCKNSDGMKHSRTKPICQYYLATAISINMVSTELECTLVIHTQVILSTWKSQTCNNLMEKLSVPI